MNRFDPYWLSRSSRTRTIAPGGYILKDVVIVGGYQEPEVSFVADNPGLALLHCYQQLHMAFGFMTLFDYV